VKTIDILDFIVEYLRKNDKMMNADIIKMMKDK